jgi:RHS repeat-associated protein
MNIYTRAYSSALMGALCLLTLSHSRAQWFSGANGTVSGSVQPSSLPLPSGTAGTQTIASAAQVWAPGSSYTSVAGGDAPDYITPEITSLARSLAGAPGNYSSAIQCFLFVSGEMEYEHYYGCKKGASLTLLERKGNDADLATLLVALLRASGYETRYALGQVAFPKTSHPNGWNLGDWLGFPAGVTDANIVSYSLSRGFPAVYSYSNAPDYLGLDRVWVEFKNGENWIKLDPAFKRRTRVNPAILPGSLSGYSRAALLAAAGGTTTSTSIEGISETNLGAYLADRTNALVAQMESAHHGADAATLFGGWTQSRFEHEGSYALFGGVVAGQQDYPALPDALLTKLKVDIFNTASSTVPVASFTLPAAQLAGRRLSLSFTTPVNTTGQALLWLDDTVFAQEPSAAVGTTVNLKISIDHPHNNAAGATLHDQTLTLTYKRGAQYALPYSFSASTGLLVRRQEILDGYRRAGLADTSREVVTESLNIIGLTWLHQTELTSSLLCGPHNIDRVAMHRLGRVGQEGNYFIDVQYQFNEIQEMSAGAPTAGLSDRISLASDYLMSAMEHGTVEQMQGADNPVVSTIKAFRLANQQPANSRKIFYANSTTTWAAIKPILSGYPGDEITRIEAAINAGGVALLPQKGNLGLNQWTGVGYLTRRVLVGGATETGMWITSNLNNLNGGSATKGTQAVSVPKVAVTSNSNPVRVNSTPVTVAAPLGKDPIDLASGDYVYSSTDLTLGSAAPRGLAFSRQYHGGRRWVNPAGMGFGWTHNWQVRATRRSAYEPALGLKGTPYDVAGALVATHVITDLLSATPDARHWTLAAATAQWLTDQLQDNAVSISIGERSLQFVRRVNSSAPVWQAPGGVTMTLTPGAGNLGWTLQERHGNTWTFDATGKLSTLKDPWNKTLTITYGGEKVSTVTDAYGRSLVFTYTGENLTRVADSTGRQLNFTFSPTARDLLTTADPEGKLLRYTYDADHRITEVRNHDQQIIGLNIHDAIGKVIEQRSQGLVDRTWKYFYAPNFGIEEDPLGGKVTHYFDAQKRATSRQDEYGRVTRTVYDGQDRVLQTVSPTGNTTVHSFDRHHNLLTTTDPAGGVTVHQYDAQHRLTKSTSPLGLDQARLTYNTKHQPLTIANHLGETTTHAYDAVSGNLLSTQDPAGNITSFSYNTKDELIGTTHPGGAVESMTLNALGDPLTMTDAKGNITSFTYNLRRQVLTRTPPGLSPETTTYDNQGRVATMTDSRGNTTSQTYSPSDKPLVTTLPGGATVTTVYNNRDWRTSVTAPRLPGEPALLTQFEYYDNGLPKRTIDALGRVTSHDYDAEDRPVLTMDPLGHATAQGYNNRNLPTSTTDALGNTATTGYDSAGRRTALTNRRSHSWAFGYDNANRLVSTTAPSGRTYGQTWNSRSLLSSLAEPSGQSTTMTYDARGRLTTRIDPTGTITYGYDHNSNLLTTTQGAVTITRTYDAHNRVITHSDGRGHAFAYAYDANHNLTSLTYEPGKTVTYAYDSRNRLTSVTDWHNRVTTFSYDGPGRLTSITRPNGTVRQNTWDAAGQLTSVMDRHPASGIPVVALRATYDAAGRLTGKLELPLWPDHRSLPDHTSTYNPDNQAQAFNALALQHDSDGNPTSGPSPATSSALVNFGWNSRNQLISGPADATYAYDDGGNRVSMTQAGATTTFVVDPNAALSRVLWRVKPDGTRTFYVYGGALLYEIEETGNAVRCYHYDHLGNTIALSDAAGKLTARAAYSAYGVLLRSSGRLDTPFLYGGAFGVQTDPNGLLQMRARYYHPRLGRFISEDPLGLSAGPNLYAYANGNPITMADPSGLDALFLYGENVDAVPTDPTFFRRHAQAQATAYNLAHSPIVGYMNIPAPHSPVPRVPILGTPTELAHVAPAANTAEFNAALRSVTKITSVTWNGHSGNLSSKQISLEELDRQNIASNATISLNGCNTGVDDNASGTFSAQRFADHFQVPTRGVVGGLSFGAPVAFISKENYLDFSPGSLRRQGGLPGQRPTFLWAQPRISGAGK